MRSLKGFLAICVIGAAAVVAACSGDDGAAGAAGAPGAAGGNGTNGTNGTPGAAGTPGSSPDGGAASGFVFLTERAQRGMAIAPVPLTLTGKTAAEIEAIGQGSYLVNAASSCGDCHSPSPDPKKYLSGGVVFPLDQAGHTVVTRNLTPDPATGLKDTEDQFVQAFQNGTDILNVGQALLLHPWLYERWMTKADIKAIYAYLRAIPAVNNSYPADNKPATTGITLTGTYNEGEKDRPLPLDADITGAPTTDPDNVIRGLAIVPLDIAYPSDPQQLALFGRGSYLVNAVVGCAECHSNPARSPTDPAQKIIANNYMTGGQLIPIPPTFSSLVKVDRIMSPSLVGKTHGFFNEPGVTFQTFVTLITQGIHAEEPIGQQRPVSFPMPTTNFRQMTLSDLEAVYTYFKWIATVGTSPHDIEAPPPARYCAADTDCITALGETCDTTNKECINTPCPNGNECAVCQKCTAAKCVAPQPADLPACFAGL